MFSAFSGMKVDDVIEPAQMLSAKQGNMMR